MRKVVIHRPGGHERLKLESHPDPVPGEGQVVVATQAIGVNYADCVVRMGLYQAARKFVGWPITPGFEFAGTVAAVGPGVTSVAPGARVFGYNRFGCYSTHVCVPQHQVIPLPAKLDMAQAAAFPTIFVTAWYALKVLTQVQPGQLLLVHSAAGGVGSALLQVARIARCRVVAVVGSSHKVDTVRALGADVIIDKSREELWPAARRAAPQGYDVVLDSSGVATLRQSYEHLASPGKLVTFGFSSMLPRKGGKPNMPRLLVDVLRMPRFNPLALADDNKSVLSFNLSYLIDKQELLQEGFRTLLGWLEEGLLSAPSVTCFPLDKVAEAHQALESGSTTGKLVLTP